MTSLRLRSLLPLGAMLLGLAVPAALVATPAMADLQVCNQTRNPVNIALGFRSAAGWQSQGWWLATPQNCAIVYQGDLDAKFYYVFAVDDIGGGVWDGTVYMCTRDQSFTIIGYEDCLARGYERTGFFEVDTQNKGDWTLHLTENDTISNGQDGDSSVAPQN